MRLRIIILVLLALLITAGFVGAVSAENIGSIKIGLKEPSAGEIPNVKENLTCDSSGVNITSINWNGNDDKFKPGNQYTVTIRLDVKEGFNFTSDITAKLNSYSCTGSELKVSNSNKTLTITHQYPRLKYGTVDPTINIYLTAPASGKEPTTPYTDSDGIDNSTISISWDKTASPVFSPNTVYKATLTIKPSTGYLFDPDSDPVVNIIDIVNNNNKFSTAVDRTDIDILTATYSFSKTNNITLDRVNLTLTAPVAGESPSIPSSNTSGISSTTVTWIPSPSTFAVNTSYKASITVKTSNGYELDDSKTNVYLNDVAVSDITKKSKTEWIVNKTFANTSSNIEISTVTISGLTAPQSGATPVTASSLSLSSTTGTTVKSIVWSPSATTFAGNTEYTATVIVETTSPYKYASTKPIVKIGSTTVTESAVTRNSDTNISFTYKFGKTTNLIYPSIIFTATPVTGNIPLDVVFTYNITNSTSQSITYGEVTSTETLSKTNDTLKHTYSKAGTYTAKITATNANGTTTKEITIKPTEEGLTASFIYTPTYGNAPLTVSFTDKSIGNIKTRQWNFNGLGTSTEKNPQFTFTSAGSHKVTLTITDIYGKTATWYEIIAVSPPLSSTGKTTEDTSSLETQKDNNNSSVFVPHPIGIIQELVKLFMALFNFDNYIMFQNNTTVTSP